MVKKSAAPNSLILSASAFVSRPRLVALSWTGSSSSVLSLSCGASEWVEALRTRRGVTSHGCAQGWPLRLPFPSWASSQAGSHHNVLSFFGGVMDLSKSCSPTWIWVLVIHSKRSSLLLCSYWILSSSLKINAMNLLRLFLIICLPKTLQSSEPRVIRTLYNTLFSLSSGLLIQILNMWGLGAPSDPLAAWQGMSDNSLLSTGFLPSAVPPSALYPHLDQVSLVCLQSRQPRRCQELPWSENLSQLQLPSINRAGFLVEE